MNKLIFFLLLLTLPCIARAQAFMNDRNPRLTDAEADWFSAKFPAEGFDYHGKLVGLFEVTPVNYGIGKFILTQSKNELSKRDMRRTVYRLILLNDDEKKLTRGYDALLLTANKGSKGKLVRVKREAAIRNALNRYPQFPPDAGKDNNEVLSAANAAFLNELYRSDLYPDPQLDFTGKKVAIFNTHCDYDRQADRITMQEYVTYIKSTLEKYGVAFTDDTYRLTAEQKKATGGYDIIIAYRCKKNAPLYYLLKQLEQ